MKPVQLDLFEYHGQQQVRDILKKYGLFIPKRGKKYEKI